MCCNLHHVDVSYASMSNMFGTHKNGLQSLLGDEQVASAPILVLGNKIDCAGAISEEELKTIFGLHGITTGKVS